MYSQVNTPKAAWNFIKPGRHPLTERREEYGPILTSWITECDTNHEDCITKNAKLPRRVLDVGCSTESRLFLHVSSEEVGRYVALSYCWGTSHPPKTTQDNLAQHLEDIRVENLPRTFQDAVIVTRNIGVRYLWIDSLCIVQDQDCDWEMESSKMAAYYSNAYLVIAADQAGDSTQGFLDALGRHSHSTQHLSAEIGQIKNPDSSISRIYKRVLGVSHYMDRHHRPLLKSPLNTRAWALQENLLAKRIVHFVEREILWECIEDLKCECMEMDHITTSDRRRHAIGAVRKDQFIRLSYNEETFGIHELWLGLLSHYSTLNISYDTDLLPALSGLANLWQSRGAGKYLAGFWEDYILESIIWVTTGGGLIQRAREYRAPSWSPFSLEDADNRTHIPFHYWGKLTTRHAMVVDTGVEAAGADPTGGVRSAFLQLRGRVTWFNVCAQSCRSEGMFCDIEFSGMSVPVQFEVEMDLSEGLNLTLILIGATSHTWCIAFALKSSGDAYERVGIVTARYDLNQELRNLYDKLLASAEETVIII